MKRAFSSPLLVALSSVAISAGVPLHYSAIERAGAKLPADLAREVEEAFSVSQDGWLSIHHLFVLPPDAFPLQSPLGLHHGWPFQQSFAAGAMKPFGKEATTSRNHRQSIQDYSRWRYGFVWNYERRGWAEEDFYLIRPDREYAAGWSAHLAGVLLDKPTLGLQFGAGLIGRNRLDWPDNIEKSRQQPWMGWGRFGFGAFQSWLIAGEEVEGWSVALDLEKRALEGGIAPGWRGYLPRIRLESEGLNDSLYFEWEQPLWNNQLYFHTRWSLDEGLEWGELVLYPDPSRFFAVAATMLQREDERLWGGLVRLGVVELGYSYAPEMEAMSGMEKSLFLRIGLSISRLTEELVAAPGAGGFSSSLSVKEQ